MPVKPAPLTSPLSIDYGPSTAVVHLKDGTPFLECARVVFTIEPAGPIVELLVELEHGAPVVSRCLIVRRPGGEAIAPSDFRVDWPAVFESAFVQIGYRAAMRVNNSTERGEQVLPGDASLTWEGIRPLISDAEVEDTRRRIRATRRRRGAVTDRDLEDTARIYLADTGGAPTVAVADELNLSHRTAARWVALARQRGYLPPYRSTEED